MLKIHLLELEKEMNKFGKFLVQQSRSRLTRFNHRDTGKLYNSLSYNLTVHKASGALEFFFNMEDYGKFQDKGVRGSKSSDKAPNSPYRFGSGTGKKGGLTEGISKWVTSRKIRFRKANGRFMTKKETVFLIVRSIFQKGLLATEFYTRPFDLGFRKLPDQLLKAYGLDFEKLMTFSLKK